MLNFIPIYILVFTSGIVYFSKDIKSILKKIYIKSSWLGGKLMDYEIELKALKLELEREKNKNYILKKENEILTFFKTFNHNN